MKAVAIVGKKKSGKTTLGLALVQYFTDKGLKVGVIKHSHHGFDEEEGTDTQQYKQIATSVAAYSPSQSFVSWSKEKPLQDLIPLLDADVIVMEGGNKIGWMPRIITVREDDDDKDFFPELAIAQIPACTNDNPPSSEEIERLATLVMEKGFLLPGLNCGACGREFCRDFAADINAGKATLNGCKSTFGKMDVTCNDMPLALNPFVADMLSAGISGMLSQLKGYVPGDLKITIKNR
ncbi:molybdopterin-guanine dinucleotide biosynthesis protein MobB [Maridesulfovibrio ferrireducens]|uniref:molybdopterin-guanine dinucleotide biosynthesis protein MobB n=1 Tax=Maridesulfovibrio ferrireducens TaxID=246191 RepID=UPI001A20369F|nr:molybdopterin-guanine dinucleotide biosynthesis protein MobB [Maridesulfovibrio ferrireducens]MBI9109849.1 molybdopterin-guanine dinucleotide biosynthesis protein MobB [Maridesulfovibrio ferrireducens]